MMLPLTCAGVEDDPIRDRLRRLQPGQDGGRPHTRKEKNWGKYDHVAYTASSRKVRKAVISRCIRAMRCKTNSANGASEKDFLQTMFVIKDTLLTCKGQHELAVAALLPVTYTETLTLLEHAGKMRHFMKEGATWAGVICGRESSHLLM